MRNEGGGLYLYTSAFSTVSTRTSTPGWAVRFKVLSGTMKVSGTMSLVVEEVIPEGTSFPIGDGYVVLTASSNAGEEKILNSFAVGDMVTLTTTCSDQRLTTASWATGCGDILVSGGNITDSTSWDSALFNYHPRTAIGVKQDGSIVCYVVDGRSSSHSSGAKMSEIADDMISMGCVDVVNLDGGGSSAMAVKLPGNNTCTVVNQPSDGYARSCGAYLLLVTDNISDGIARNLFIKEDGIYVLAGSSIQLNCIATDDAANPAGDALNVTAASSGLGSINGNIYTAGSVAGDDRIALSSPSGATGYGTIHVITQADAIDVVDASTGKAPGLSNMEIGESVTFNVELTKLSRPVVMDQLTVTYEVQGEVGTIDESGTFTAAGLPGTEGKIIIKAGGLEKALSVALKRSFVDTDGHWAEDYIDTLLDFDIVQGTGDMRYEPDVSISRGDFVLMMWRTMGSPAPAESVAFSDVPADSYYAEAIAWAKEAGISNGIEDNIFGPKEPLIREQAFTLIYRLLTYSGEQLPSADASVLEPFSDSGNISPYAVEPIAILVSHGLIEGSDGKLSPDNTMTRAEMAKVLAVAMYDVQ